MFTSPKLSYVTCHGSFVACHMSHVTSHVSYDSLGEVNILSTVFLSSKPALHAITVIVYGKDAILYLYFITYVGRRRARNTTLCYYEERRDIRWYIAWARGKSRGRSLRDFPRAQAIFTVYPDLSVFNIILNSTFALHIVKSLVIIEFSFVEKTSQMSLTHKITDLPYSQNTFRKQILQNILIQY